MAAVAGGLERTIFNAILALLLSVVFSGCGGDFTCNVSDSTDCSCATITQPTSTTVLSNTDITLLCTVTTAVGNEVQWLQGDTPLGNDPNIPCCPRYSMSTLNGDYSLMITNVRVTDENSYWCQIPDCATQKPASPAQLTVYVLPTGPAISNDIDGYVNVVVNDYKIWLECSAYNSKPEATVRWYDLQTGLLLQQNITTSTSEPNSDQAYTTTVSYSFQPTVTDNQARYRCDILGDAVDLAEGVGNSLTKIVTIYAIETPGDFTTGVTNGGTFVIDDNEEAIVYCKATSSSQNLQLFWYKSTILQNTTQTTTSGETNGTDMTYYFSNSISITGDDANDGQTYRCSVIASGYAKEQVYEESLRFTVSVYKFPYAAVIGGSVGGFILILLLLILLICLLRRSKRKKVAEEEARIQREIQATVIANETATSEQNEDAIEEEEVVVPKAVAEFEQELKADLGYSSESETSAKTDEETSSDAESDKCESVYPPSGEEFSLSSSMMRSDRGSPVVMYSDLDERSTYSNDTETAVLPSPRGTGPIYYTRETGTRMLTDV